MRAPAAGLLIFWTSVTACHAHDDGAVPNDSAASDAATVATVATAATSADAAPAKHAGASLLPPYPGSPPCDATEDSLPWVRSVDAAGPVGIDALAAGQQGSLWVAAADRAVRFDRTGAPTTTAKAPAGETLQGIALDRSDHLYALATIATGASALDVLRFGTNGQVAARRAITGDAVSAASAISLRPNGDSFVAVTFRGKLAVEKLTLESATPTLAVVALDADLHPVWAHAYDLHQDAAKIATAVDASGNLVAAIPFRNTASFGAFDVKASDAAKADLALVTFDANGSVTAARATRIAAADATPLRLLVDKQGSSIVLTRDLVLVTDALGQEVYRHALPGNTVQTAALATNGEVTLLETNGTDDAGAPRLALVRLDRNGDPRAMTDKDRGIATGAAGGAVMMVDHCGALTLATKAATGFTVATHVAN